ncbi:MAG: hypothetical protein M5U28_46775 [Sandaracinaceae bacterium]|nr:hypothetical protein [Sandaracinaceae bacterium]
MPMPCEDPQGVDFLLVLDDSGSIRPRDARSCAIACAGSCTA